MLVLLPAVCSLAPPLCFSSKPLSRGIARHQPICHHTRGCSRPWEIQTCPPYLMAIASFPMSISQAEGSTHYFQPACLRPFAPAVPCARNALSLVALCATLAHPSTPSPVGLCSVPPPPDPCELIRLSRGSEPNSPLIDLLAVGASTIALCGHG